MVHGRGLVLLYLISGNRLHIYDRTTKQSPAWLAVCGLLHFSLCLVIRSVGTGGILPLLFPRVAHVEAGHYTQLGGNDVCWLALKGINTRGRM